MTGTMGEATGDILVAGHICLDLIPEITTQKDSIAELLAPGRLLNVGGMVTSTGGAVANTGLALHKLGLPVRLVGKVGQDVFGDVIRSLLTRHGANLADSLVVDDRSHTSYTIVLNPPGIDRIFLHHPGTNDSFHAGDLLAEHVRGASIMHFGYPPLMRRIFANGGWELELLLRTARTAGLATSLDMSMPDPNSESGRVDWPALLRRVLPLTDVFMPSFEELEYMLRAEKLEATGRPRTGEPIAFPPIDTKPGEDPVDKFVTLALKTAHAAHVEEIHFQPSGETFRLRFRAGGELQEMPSPPPAWGHKITARFKILGKLDLLKKKVAQKNHVGLSIGAETVDATIATEPTDHGEHIVVRFGAESSQPMTPSTGEEAVNKAWRMAQWCIDAGAAIVALKLGDQGLYLRTTESAERLRLVPVIPQGRLMGWMGRELLSPCFLVNEVGATGAGDCTIAGFLASLHNGAGPIESVTLATAVGACNVEAADATSGIVSRDAVLARIQAGWKRKAITIPMTGWDWLVMKQVWMGPHDMQK